MYKKQMTIQRILCLAAIIASVVVFLYALGIMTDLYDSLYNANNFGVAGTDVYYNMQGFNQQLLAGSIVMILLGAFLFVTNTHIRRRYYVGNYVATGLYAVGSIALAVYSHIQILIYKAQFFEVDFEQLQFYSTLFPTDVKYTESTAWLDAHYAVFAILIVVAVLLVANAIWKAGLMKAESELLAEEDGAIARDRMRFIKNSLASNLAILGILFDVFYFVSIYKSDVGNYYYNIQIGASVVYNLIFMLAVFLASEGVKNYKKNYSYLLIGIGIMQIVRIFVIPMQAHTTPKAAGGLEMVMGYSQFSMVVAFLGISAACLIASAVVNFIRCKGLSARLKELESQKA